jgi:hypothetical protein
MNAHGGLELQLHLFLTKELDEGAWSASRLCHITLGERAPGICWKGGWERPGVCRDFCRNLLPQISFPTCSLVAIPIMLSQLPVCVCVCVCVCTRVRAYMFVGINFVIRVNEKSRLIFLFERSSGELNRQKNLRICRMKLSVKLITLFMLRACYVRALCALLREGSASVLQQRSLQASGLPTRRVWNRIKQLHHRFRSADSLLPQRIHNQGQINSSDVNNAWPPRSWGSCDIRNHFSFVSANCCGLLSIRQSACKPIVQAVVRRGYWDEMLTWVV